MRHLWRTALASFLLIGLAAGLFVAWRESSRFRAREVARDRVAEYDRLADEARFYLANSDAADEQVPYYDAPRGDWQNLSPVPGAGVDDAIWPDVWAL